MKVICAALLLVVLGLCNAQEFALRHSFQPPFHEHTQLPFWDVAGGGRVMEDFVRITPAKQSRMGFAWNNVPSTMSQWEVTIEFQITGQQLGGEGFAFWYAEKPEMLGAVYGSMDYWNGLGIFFDTYNNDATGDHPAIVAVLNDGRLKYDHATDGSTQASASCQMNFRGLTSPSKARIKYEGSQLTVEVALTPGAAFEECFRVPNIELGVDKYFGVTAATGDVADNHDIFSVQTRNLSPQNVNLDDVRQRYRQKYHAQNTAETRAASQRDIMDPKEFQDEVLGLLNQIQSAQNLMETSQVAIANMLQNERLAAGTATSTQTTSQPRADTSNLGPRFEEIARSQQTLLDKLNGMQSSLNGRPANAAGGGGSDSAQLSQLQRDLSGVVTTINGVSGQTNHAANQATKSVQNSEEILKKVDQLLASGTGGGDGGGGWVGMFIYILLGVAIGYGITKFAGKGDRYGHKLP